MEQGLVAHLAVGVRIPHRRLMIRRRGSTLETVLRIRDSHGFVASEFTIYSDSQTVQCVNFWPNGKISTHGEISLEVFLTEVERFRAAVD